MKFLIDAAVLLSLYIFYFYPKWKELTHEEFSARTLMFVYISLVLYVTLMPIIAALPFIGNHPYRMMHMKPFEDLLLHRTDALRQVILNVFMMVPFGFLYPLIKGKSFFRCVLAVFLFSLMIETLQPLLSLYRSSDITDLITNTLGGIIGYLIYMILMIEKNQENAVV